MAEHIVMSAAQWIGLMVIQEGKLLYGVEDQVRSLQQELQLMQQHYLQDADAKQGQSDVGILIREIRKLAYDAEDVIDTYILQVQSNNLKGSRNLLRKIGRFMYDAPHTYRIGVQIKVIHKGLNEVTEKFARYGVRRITDQGEGPRPPFDHEMHQQWQQPRYLHGSEYVVGLEKDIELLVQVLMGDKMNQVSFLSIVGMGGSGKTTLARKLYNHPYTVDCFNCKGWISISQEWNPHHVLSQIVRMVGGPETSTMVNTSMEGLVETLHSELKKKACLIVFDDVWKKEALKEILDAFSRGNIDRRSKIIITTRNREIVHLPFLQNQYIHEAQPLSETEAWELFSKLALSRKRQNMTSFEILGKDMIKKCNGLPLAIVALAGILSNKNTIHKWQKVREAVRSRLMETMDTHMSGIVGDLLALSYHDLPYGLKLCFLYLSVFPEDCEIPAGMLTRMWIAEGLVNTHEDVSLEDLATDQLEELSHRFMVQVVRTNLVGEIKAVRLHDLMRDLCVRKAKEHNFLQIFTPRSDLITRDNNPFAVKPRRVALHSRASFPTQISHLRSLVLLTQSSTSCLAYASKVSKVSLELNVIHTNFKLLRLLNLWGIKTSNGNLPSQIGNLIHLRYLGIRATNIVELPESIGSLRNLLTLDYRNVDLLDSTLKRIKIPNALGRLTLMRHLFLPMDFPWDVQDLELNAMKDLQILWGIKQEGENDHWFSTEVKKLSATLKKLKIVLSTEGDLAAMFYWSSRACNNMLHTLHCEWRDGVALRPGVVPISHCEFLYKLTLIGQIQIELSLVLPRNLVTLVLKDSILEAGEDPFAKIGELPQLKLLKLSNSYLGDSFASKRDSFPQLEELWMEGFTNLHTWRIEEGSMLSLKKLTIYYCRNLQHFPNGLLFVKNLQHLEAFGMPKEFYEKAEEQGWSWKLLTLSRNCEAIIRQSDSIIDMSSLTKLHEQLSVGIFLNQRKQKYWVMQQHEQSCNCFTLYPACFTLYVIPYRGRVEELVEKNYNGCWNWIKFKESDGTLITAGEVVKVKNLDRVQGFDMDMMARITYNVWAPLNVEHLSLHVSYEIAYVIMLPVIVKSLTLPKTVPYNIVASVSTYLSHTSSYTYHERQCYDLSSKPRGEWIRLSVGKFEATRRSKELIRIHLCGCVPGMVIKCVEIEPSISDKIPTVLR